jgi:hypothetical protein
MLDEFARRVFDKFAPSKRTISALLLDKFARRANSLLKLGTLLDSVNSPLESSGIDILTSVWDRDLVKTSGSGLKMAMGFFGIYYFKQ